ncbi:MAG TPA: mycofactocin-associated electron transfer flavoprotein beta subunit [Acidimicrobiales bacterium]|nr:mycofactocin-associated electron transfer flavoprotein beta subunit [Acidimicrobiales bacterium]
MTVVACLKWVDHKPDVDPLTGAVRTDWRTSGLSDADRAALEWALRLGGEWGEPVVAVSAGPAAADAVLVDALSAGATRAVRVELPLSAPSDTVARAIAGAVGPRPRLVLCGVWSLDRGSGSVPAFLAAELGAAQALGLVSLSADAASDGAASDGAASDGAVLAERRLDRGARERLRVPLPAVCSVEGASARLRRAALPGVLSATRAAIEVVPATTGAVAALPVRTGPFRPRARALPAPASPSARERVLELTGALSHREPPQTLYLEPAVAARELLARLEAWGYR